MRNVGYLFLMLSLLSLPVVLGCEDPVEDPETVGSTPSASAGASGEARTPARPTVEVQAPRATVEVQAPSRPTVEVQAPTPPSVTVTVPRPPSIMVTAPSVEVR